MYLSFYNLKIKPFQITTDPNFLWMGEKHREALATLEYGIRENKGFLLLTGDVGTGKTALINQLIRALDIETRVATIPDPGLDKLDFLRFLARQFNITEKFQSKGAFLIKFREFLEEADAKHSKVLLIIDEAQRLNHALLEEIRLLSNIELHDKKLINIFFVGQNEFNQLLMDDKNRAVRQRLSVRYELEPLTLDETSAYIAHRLKVAGSQRRIFSPSAIKEVYKFSNGNPRLTNIICDHALLTGYARNIKEISETIITECAAELHLPHHQASMRTEHIKEVADVTPDASTPPAEKPKRSPMPLSVVVLILGAVMIAGYLIYQERTESVPQWAAEDLVPKAPPVATKENMPLEGTEPAKAPTDGSTSAVESTPPAGEAGGQTKETPQESGDLSAVQTLTMGQTEKIIIYFNHNSNELPPGAYDTLDRLSTAVRNENDLNIEINGYTDSSGSASYNQSMSKFRANIIKSYLVGKGIDPQLITTAGLGAVNPIASNDTAEGRKKNRRVEIVINRSPAP